MSTQDDIPTTPAFMLWKCNHDHVVNIAERLYDWADKKSLRLDPVSRRSVHSRDQQRIQEGLRLRDLALVVGFELAAWERFSPSPDECQRQFNLVKDIEAKANTLMLQT